MFVYNTISMGMTASVPSFQEAKFQTLYSIQRALWNNCLAAKTNVIPTQDKNSSTVRADWRSLNVFNSQSMSM